MSLPSDGVCFDGAASAEPRSVSASDAVCSACSFRLLVLSYGSTTDRHINPLGVCYFAVFVL